MKRVLFFTVFLLLLASMPVFAGPFGPAEAQVKPGEFSLGVGAFHYADKWKFERFTSSVQQNQFFAQVDIGLFPTWETYLRAGIADLKVDGALALSDLEGDYEFFSTVGVKGLIRRGKYLDFGGFIEASLFHEYSDSSPQVRRIIVDEAFEVNAGLSFQKEIEGALLYGGPFYHYREGDLWFVTAQDSGLESFSGKFQEKSNFGGFLGIRWVFLEDIVVQGELQLRDKLSAGAVLSFIY